MRGPADNKVLRVDPGKFAAKSGSGRATMLASLPCVIKTNAIRLRLGELVFASSGAIVETTGTSTGGGTREMALAIAGAAVAAAVEVDEGESSRTNPRE